MTEPRKPLRSPVWLVHALIAAWAAGLFVISAVDMEHPAAIVGLITAGVTIVALLLGIVVWSWMEGLVGATLSAAGGLVATGLVLGGETGAMIAASGVLGLVVVAATAPLGFAFRPVAGSSRGDARSDGRLVSILERMHETSMLSDNAKRVLFRRRELELLHHAIEEDIDRGDYDAALTLCDALSTLFGHREASERYRLRIMRVRRERYDADVDAAMDHFLGLLESRDWAIIHQEAASLRRLYPDSHRIADLDQLILNGREEHKHQLERSFLQAAERDDIPGAMGLLRELDRYLNADEGQRLVEVAGGVITKHRENLSTRFRMAVAEHRWAEAASVGDTIIDEFPNTKMADEVRSMIDILRTRATEVAVGTEGV